MADDMNEPAKDSPQRCIVCRRPITIHQSQIGHYAIDGSGVAYHRDCDGVFEDIRRAVLENEAPEALKKKPKPAAVKVNPNG